MYELYPYFTNDGTVGLFSRQDDDIYHSTYGALTESWEKFIIPSHFERYIATHSSVKVLDICYGIGYNTKTALNVIVNNLLNDENFKNKIKNNKNNSENLSENLSQPLSNIAAIYTNNNSNDFEVDFAQNPNSESDNSTSQSINIEAIDVDNINAEISGKIEEKTEKKATYNVIDENNSCNNILIDAVDLDKILMELSPFIAEPTKSNLLPDKESDLPTENKIKYQQIKTIKKSKKIIKKEFRLKKEVSIILFEKLLKQNPSFFEDPILQVILSHKKYSPFLSKFMLNFASFYQNQGYKDNKKQNKMAFLHNIYYRYVSESYKNAQNLLSNAQVDINFVKNDARHFVKSTSNKYNFIFLDAFTPAKCPALWSVQFFREIFSKLEDDGMILTYSNSAAIRNALLQNGFHVGKTYDKNSKKFVGTIATKNKDLIEYELDERDMDLINSKAGICFKDDFLESDNSAIIARREAEIKNSELISSSQVLKGYKHEHAEIL